MREEATQIWGRTLGYALNYSGVLMATAFTVIKNAIKHNLKLLGAGRYSAVFELNNYEVLKIGSDINDPFLDYLDIIKTNPSIHFLKVNELYKSDNYYIAKLEKLHHNNKINLSSLSSSISVLSNNIKSCSKLDLHSENIMCRADGTLVLTDPLCQIDMYDVLDVSDWLDYYYKNISN